MADGRFPNVLPMIAADGPLPVLDRTDLGLKPPSIFL
jgi:hypothetical protein